MVSPAPPPKLMCDGAYIRDTRIALGLDQEQFGRLLDVGTYLVSKWENDRVRVNPWQRTILEAIGQSLRHVSGIRPDLDAILDSCGPVYVLWLLLNRAFGVTSASDRLAPPE